MPNYLPSTKKTLLAPLGMLGEICCREKAGTACLHDPSEKRSDFPPISRVLARATPASSALKMPWLESQASLHTYFVEMFSLRSTSPGKKARLRTAKFRASAKGESGCQSSLPRLFEHDGTAHSGESGGQSSCHDFSNTMEWHIREVPESEYLYKTRDIDSPPGNTFGNLGRQDSSRRNKIFLCPNRVGRWGAPYTAQ